jgi:hypothetical protein
MFEDLRDQFREGRAIGKSDAERIFNGPPKTLLRTIVVLITLLGAALFELLGYHTKWALVPRIGLSVLATGMAQLLAVRLFSRVHPKD